MSNRQLCGNLSHPSRKEGAGGRTGHPALTQLKTQSNTSTRKRRSRQSLTCSRASSVAFSVPSPVTSGCWAQRGQLTADLALEPRGSITACAPVPWLSRGRGDRGLPRAFLCCVRHGSFWAELPSCFPPARLLPVTGKPSPFSPPPSHRPGVSLDSVRTSLPTRCPWLPPVFANAVFGR